MVITKRKLSDGQSLEKNAILNLPRMIKGVNDTNSDLFFTSNLA